MLKTVFLLGLAALLPVLGTSSGHPHAEWADTCPLPEIYADSPVTLEEMAEVYKGCKTRFPSNPCVTKFFKFKNADGSFSRKVVCGSALDKANRSF